MEERSCPIVNRQGRVAGNGSVRSPAVTSRLIVRLIGLGILLLSLNGVADAVLVLSGYDRRWLFANRIPPWIDAPVIEWWIFDLAQVHRWLSAYGLSWAACVAGALLLWRGSRMIERLVLRGIKNA